MKTLSLLLIAVLAAPAFAQNSGSLSYDPKLAARLKAEEEAQVKQMVEVQRDLLDIHTRLSLGVQELPPVPAPKTNAEKATALKKLDGRIDILRQKLNKADADASQVTAIKAKLDRDQELVDKLKKMRNLSAQALPVEYAQSALQGKKDISSAINDMQARINSERAALGRIAGDRRRFEEQLRKHQAQRSEFAALKL